MLPVSTLLLTSLLRSQDAKHHQVGKVRVSTSGALKSDGLSLTHYHCTTFANPPLVGFFLGSNAHFLLRSFCRSLYICLIMTLPLQNVTSMSRAATLPDWSSDTQRDQEKRKSIHVKWSLNSRRAPRLLSRFLVYLFNLLLLTHIFSIRLPTLLVIYCICVELFHATFSHINHPSSSKCCISIVF